MEDSNSSLDNQNKKQEKLTPAELVKKHMENPDNPITEEEMKNLKTGPEADEDLIKKEEDKYKEVKRETGKHPPNPYDVLGS